VAVLQVASWQVAVPQVAVLAGLWCRRSWCRRLRQGGRPSEVGWRVSRAPHGGPGRLWPPWGARDV